MTWYKLRYKDDSIEPGIPVSIRISAISIPEHCYGLDVEDVIDCIEDLESKRIQI